MALKRLLLVFVCFVFCFSYNVNCQTETASALSSTAVENSDLRKGFQFVYSIVNGFLDSMPIKYPSEWFSVNTTTITWKQFQDRVVNYFQSSDWQGYVNKIYSISPGLFIFLVFEVAFIILLPIIGFVVCCITCCSKKDLYDSKSAKTTRKLFAVILFVALIALLLIVVVIFATNSYANQAVRRTSTVAQQTTQGAREFITSDLKNFTDGAKSALDGLKDTIPTTLDNTEDILIDAINQQMDDLVDPIYNEVTDNYLSVFKKTNEINMLLSNVIFAQWRSNAENITLVTNNNNLLNPPAFQQILFSQSISDEIALLDDKNTVLNYTALLSLVKDETETYKNELNSTVEQVFSDIEKGIDDIYNQVKNETGALDQIDSAIADINKYINYYDYGYYSFLGISILMLLIFVFYMLGCLGICCSRKHENQRQSCHRGVSAGCLSFGLALYFIFGSLLMILCLVLFVGGFSARNFVCEPLVQLDDNKLVQFALKVEEIHDVVGNINFKNTIDECRSTNSIENVGEIKNFLKSTFNINMDDFRNLNSYMNTFNAELSSFYATINSTNLNFPHIDIPVLKSLDDLGFKKTDLDSIKNAFNTDLTAHKFQFTQISQFLNSPSSAAQDVATQSEFLRSIIQDYNSTLIQLESLVNEWYAAGINNTAVTNSINLDLNNLNAKINGPSYLNDLSKNIIINTIENYAKPQIESNLNKTLIKDVPLLPSCKLISTVYDDVTVNVCYEIVDNMNGYWFALWLSLLIYFLLIGFAVKYTSLLRKLYSYESDDFANLRSSPTKSDYYDANSVPLRQMQPNGRRVHPIDAYTNKANGYASSHTPPPSYNYKSQRL